MAAATEQAVAQPPQRFQAQKPTLFDVPVSNNGGRVRYSIYKKGLDSEIDIQSPTICGGLKSDTYLELNPFRKFPTLALPSGKNVIESAVIVQYLEDAYPDKQPSLVPTSLDQKTNAYTICRVVDIYLQPVMGSMYKGGMDAEARAAGIAEINHLLDVLEGLAEGPFLTGCKPSIADGALFPSFTFIEDMLPRVFGWKDIFKGRPKLAAWWRILQDQDACAAKVIEEIRGGLQGWKDKDRWNSLGIIEQVKTSGQQFEY